MNISIVRALDHYTAHQRKRLGPILIDSMGEIYQEDEDYLILRSFHSYDHDSSFPPIDEFSVIVKSAIRKRIDLVVDLDEGVFVGQHHPKEKEEKEP